MNTNQAIINPYLFFNGRCEEAIEFYTKALGGKLLMLMRFKDSPDPAPPGMVPPGFEEKVMHASMQVGSTMLMLSDGCEAGASKFQGFSLSLAFPTETEAQAAFRALSEQGKVNMPLTKTFWSPCFGMLEDKFGIGWMVTVISEHTK
jgi:PhnB protein